MDFNFSKTVNRHLRKIKHECNQLLLKGVFVDDLDRHPITVPMFYRGETISESELENLDSLYSYLYDEGIAVRNKPLRPSVEDGTLDCVGDVDNGFEYITTQDVMVLNYDTLKSFLEDNIDKPSSLDQLDFSHLKNRALRFNGKDFYYHGNKLLFPKSKAKDYLKVMVALTKDEKKELTAGDVLGVCGHSSASKQPFNKILKDSISQTILPKFGRFHDNDRDLNFAIETREDDLIVVKNPISHSPI